MSGKQQHTDYYRKLMLRQRLLKHIQPGAAYVPFIGSGDLASELYQAFDIYGADIDEGFAQTARERLPTADIRIADCDQYPFGDVAAEFVLADFDAYANPYPAIESFWAHAEKAPRIVVFGTDGIRQDIKRHRAERTLPSGRTANAPNWRRQFNSWWSGYVLPWLHVTCTGYKIVQKAFYTRRDMLYWGLLLER